MARAMVLAALALSVLDVSAVRGADVPKSGAPEIAAITTEGEKGPGVPAFQVAAGYRLTVAADAMPESRFMVFDNFGTLYVSQPGKGSISSYTRQPDGTYKFNALMVKGKRTTHGMQFVDGYLWFTQSSGVYKGKVRQDGSGLDDVTEMTTDGSVPSGGGHWYRSILVGPDCFYTSVGDAQNMTDMTDKAAVEKEGPHSEDRSKIWKYSLDGKTKTEFVSGIRNTEKLMYRPGTQEVWGCDHGTDLFGYTLGDKNAKDQPITDHLPGEEINHYEQGKFYGHPYVVDANIVRPEYANRPDIKEILARSTPPVYLLPAHFADNGWTWLHADSALGKTGDMYVTSHGSWNSSVKVGYCVSKLEFDASGKPGVAVKVLNCLSANGTVLGRPVDAVEDPADANSLLISVDAPKGRVYRLTALAAK